MPSARVVDAQEGVIAYDPPRRKVAIVGAGGTRGLAPYDDQGWVVWGLNEIEQIRADAYFELHPMAVQDGRELRWLGSARVPVYLLELDPRVPTGLRYPLERVLAATSGRRYFTCTFAFQIALALAEGFEEIGLWGVELDYGSTRERLVEKPCVEYWLGLAEGRGVRVTLPPGASLLQREFFYGYEYADELAAINRVCDGLLFTVPRARWPGLLLQLGCHFGGKLEAVMATAAAELSRIP